MTNNTLLTAIKTQAPKVTLDQKEQNRYKAGLSFLAAFVSESFFDIDLLPSDRHSTEGAYYNIPFFHDTTIGFTGNSRTLVTLALVTKTDNGYNTIEYPARIDFTVEDENNFEINVIDQTGAQNQKLALIKRHNGEYTSQIPDYATVTLSELLTRIALQD